MLASDSWSSMLSVSCWWYCMSLVSSPSLWEQWNKMRVCSGQRGPCVHSSSSSSNVRGAGMVNVVFLESVAAPVKHQSVAAAEEAEECSCS